MRITTSPANAAGPITTPVGTAGVSTRRSKPGTYRRRFGPGAGTKPGMPMVAAEIIVSWIGASG